MATGDALSLDQAIRRLLAALGRLELSATARLESEQGLEPLETELAMMRDDRSRLAVELDGALARNATLEHTTQEVAARLNRAIEGVRSIIGGAAGAAKDR
jgi:Domain of unknown function (DUF4164)